MYDVPPHELASPPDLTGLCCLQCGYNLTGLTETRCPECGTMFDPAELRRLLDPTPRCVAALGFWDLWWQTIAQPAAFAQQFPAVHDGGQARGFGWLVSILSAAIFLGGTLVLSVTTGRPGFMLSACAGIAIGTLAAMALCELACAAVLATLLAPIGMPHGLRQVPHRFHFWHGLTRYGRSFAVFTALWTWLPLLTLPWFGDSEMLRTAVSLLAPLVALVVFLSWSYAIGQMVRARGPRGVRRVLGLLSIPVVGLLSIWIGAVLSGLAAGALLAMFQ